MTSRETQQGKKYTTFTASYWIAWSLLAACIVILPACRSAARPPTLANVSPPALPSSGLASVGLASAGLASPNAAAKANSQPVASTAPQVAQHDSPIATVSMDPAAQREQVPPEGESSLASANEALPVATQVMLPEVQAESLPTAAAAQTVDDATKFVLASHATEPQITAPPTTAMQAANTQATNAHVANTEATNTEATPLQATTTTVVDSANSAGQSTAMAKVQLVIDGVRVGRGIVHVAYFNGGQGFPDAQYAIRTESLASGQESVTTAIQETGKIAIAVYQDINNDGTLNVNRFGIPVEPFAFSNNAMGKRGPPSFEGAVVDASSPAIRSSRAIRIQLP